MARWQCMTHNVTLDVTAQTRHLRGMHGQTGACVLSQPKPESAFGALATGQTTRWVMAGRSRAAEQVQEVTDHE